LFSAVLIDRLKSSFDFIKRHYGVINTICGLLLIAVGLLMATGILGRLLTILN
jgi:cytochrome c-type biogenesis protein